jgi:hypothetical protein
MGFTLDGVDLLLKKHKTDIMSTRAIIRFATRESGVSFSEHPEKWHAQLYKNRDGHPESLGLDIANSIVDGVGLDDIEIDSLDTKRGNLDYIYYIWQHYNKSTWMSIFKVGDEVVCDQPDCCRTLVSREDKCIFVGEPIDLQDQLRDGGFDSVVKTTSY